MLSRLRYAVAIGAAVLSHLACSSDAAGGPSIQAEEGAPPDWVGTISTRRVTGLAVELLLGALEPPAGLDRVFVRVDPASEVPVFVRRASGALEEASVDDLVVGARVRVWTTGMMLRSYPPQVFAARIEITESSSP